MGMQAEVSIKLLTWQVPSMNIVKIIHEDPGEVMDVLPGQVPIWTGVTALHGVTCFA